MNAFYSSPVGQKVIEELPTVLQEGMQAATPILSQYLSEFKDRMQEELKNAGSTPAPATSSPK
jgi:hypothetical protein